MQWSELRAQYRALSESQLTRVLSQYRFPDDRPPPFSWRPPPDTPLSEEVTISLTSHPPFVLPQHGVEMDLKPPFPPALHTHLHDIINRFFASSGAHDQTSFSTGYGHHHSPSTAQPPSHLNLPLPPGPHGTFFSTSLSSPPTTTATTLRTDVIHHHVPSEPSYCTQHNNSAQEIRSPPLPHRNRDPRRDSKSPPPPPLPPRRPPRTSITAHNSGDPSRQELSNHREQSESRSSAAGPPQHGFNGGNVREHVSSFTAHESGASSVVGCGSKAEEERTDKKRKDSGVSNKDVKILEVLEHCHVPERATMPPVVEATIQSTHVPQNEKLPSLCSAMRDTHSSSSNSYNNNNSNSGSNHTTTNNNRFQFEGPPPSPATARLSISQKLLPSSSAQQDPATAAKMNTAPRQRPVPQESPNEPRRSQDLRMPLPELKARDPRRRPLSGAVLSSGTGLTLQDKRILNQVPGLEIPSETVSLVSESAISDDVFVHSSAGLSGSSAGLGSSAQVAEFRRFSTGMLSHTSGTRDGEEREDRPRVVRVEMREGVSPGQLTADQCPAADDIYIDVAKEMSRVKGREGSVGGTLKMLPHEDNSIVIKTSVNGGQGSGREDALKSVSCDVPRVVYRHTMPQERDLSTKGEITGEVFTLSLLKEGARLGMGLVDGLYTPLQLPGIYVRNVLAGTPAALCGHIRVGDRILAVNGRSIVGSDYNCAMKLIRSAGPRLNLLVAKCDRSVTARISAS